MSKKTLIIISCSALILTLCVSSYLYFQSKALSENKTVCKNNTNSSVKTSTNPSSQSSSQNTTEKTSSTDTSGTKGTINTVGNTNAGIHNHGLIAQQDKWVFFKYNGLCRSMIDMKTGFKRLNYDTPENINVLDKWVYYTSQNTLYKIPTEGGNKIKLSEDKMSNVIVTGESIYYINCLDNKICRINTDGKNKIELSNDSCGSFSLDRDSIYYNCISESEAKIYKIKIDGTNKTEMVTSKCALPIIDNDFLCYLSNPSGDNKIVRMKLDGSEKKEFNTPMIKKYAFHKNQLYYVDLDLKLYKTNLETNKCELVVDITKHIFTAAASLNFVNDDLLFFSNSTDILKINKNGTVEKININLNN